VTPLPNVSTLNALYEVRFIGHSIALASAVVTLDLKLVPRSEVRKSRIAISCDTFLPTFHPILPTEPAREVIQNVLKNNI
jgi:hypothetical protein